MQRGRTDHQVLKSNRVAPGRLLPLDPSRELGNLKCHWINDQIVEGFLRKDEPPVPISFGLGAKNAMRQLDNAHGRYTDIDLTMNGQYLLKHVIHCAATSLSCNQDAGIDDESQAINPTPRWRAASDRG